MIGVIDSGLSGLVVMQALRDHLPGYDLVFFADTAHGPYGGKSVETIQAFSTESIQILIDLGATLIIAACPMISVLMAESRIGPFIVPVFNIVEPAIETAVRVSTCQRVGILGVQSDLEKKTYEQRILKLNPDAEIHSISSPLLESIVTEEWSGRPEAAMITKKYLHRLKVRQIDTLILARNHHRVLKKTIQRKIGKFVKLVEPWEVLAGYVKAHLVEHKKIDSTLGKSGNRRFLVTDRTSQVEHSAGIFYDRRIKLETIPIKQRSRSWSITDMLER